MKNRGTKIGFFSVKPSTLFEMMRMLSHFKKSGIRIRSDWGLGLLVFALLWAMMRALFEFQAGHGHYTTFVMASRSLWQGTQTYFMAQGDNPYYYSPGCGLFLFGPFSVLPDRLGLGLYLSLSGWLFVAGISRFAAIKELCLNSRHLNLFWALIAPLAFSSMLAHKLELMSTGLLFLSAALLIEGKGRASFLLSAVLLAAVTDWKLQPLPTVGLLSVFLLSSRRLFSPAQKMWPVYFAGALGFWMLLPLTVRSPSELGALYSDWSSSLNLHSSRSFDFFDNLFAFLKNTLGVGLLYFESQLLALLVGVLFAGVMGYWSLKNRARSAAEGTLFALALGAGFTILFSPLQQINATVLIAPAYFAAFWVIQNDSHASLFWKKLLLGVALVITLGYSDLVPEVLRTLIRHSAARPVACGVLVVAIAGRLLKHGLCDEAHSQISK